MYYIQVQQKYGWKTFLCRCLFKILFLGLISFLGCSHASQITDNNAIYFNLKPRLIDVETTIATAIGQEALDKLGYEEIIKIAYTAGFVEYKSDVRIQLASNETTVAAGFAPVFSRYAVAAAVTSQADSPLPGPADIAAVGIVVIGLVDAGLLDGSLLHALSGWLFAKAKTEVAGGSAKIEFPSADQLARKLGVSESQFHRQTKPEIVQDLASEARKLGTKNPDIGFDSAGHVVLRNPRTGETFITDVLLESYGP